MAKVSRQEREALAEKRLLANLRTHVIATARTLEQKISDAGPFNQRIDPHILTPIRNQLVKAGKILSHKEQGTDWFYLPETTQEKINERWAVLLPVYQAINAGNLPMRVGQALEIATFKALQAGPMEEFSGRFTDLDEHDDSTLYRKEEPPSYIGNRALPGKQNLDFIVRHETAKHLGIECKNVRPWLYPHDDDVLEPIRKCLILDAVPVLIGRRIPYASFVVLSRCGVIMHQTYNQLLPATAAEIAEKAKQKDLLGYHDIRTSNEPDARLLRFITENLPDIADEARTKFDQFKDLLDEYVNGGMSYEEFSGRARRRDNGEAEDFDE